MISTIGNPIAIQLILNIKPVIWNIPSLQQAVAHPIKIPTSGCALLGMTDLQSGLFVWTGLSNPSSKCPLRRKRPIRTDRSSFVKKMSLRGGFAAVAIYFHSCFSAMPTLWIRFSAEKPRPGKQSTGLFAWTGLSNPSSKCPLRRKRPIRTDWSFSGGGGRIRTIEAIRSRFTVCPLWPLGNSPIFNYLFQEPVWSR